MIEAGKETTCVPITWEHSFLESNTILGNLNFISDFLGPRESIRIQESKHAPSEMESKLPTGVRGGGSTFYPEVILATGVHFNDLLHPESA